MSKFKKDDVVSYSKPRDERFKEYANMTGTVSAVGSDGVYRVIFRDSEGLVGLRIYEEELEKSE